MGSVEGDTVKLPSAEEWIGLFPKHLSYDKIDIAEIRITHNILNVRTKKN